MPLEQQCAKYQGTPVFVLPVEGFGWCRRAAGLPASEPGDWVEPPAPFRARIAEFHYLAGAIKAGIATVEEKGHPADGKWVGFCLRDRGADLYDFAARPGNFNLSISDTKPLITIDPNRLAMPEWMESAILILRRSRRGLRESAGRSSGVSPNRHDCHPIVTVHWNPY